MMNSGIVVTAASAALFLNIQGGRHFDRLVLITFLSSSALWGLVDFITTLIDPTAVSACQVGVIFTTLLDQVARFSIEQFLLWAINANTKASVGQIVPQGLLVARLVMGGVFVGLSKPQFNTVCVPISSVLIVAIVTVALDGVIIATLAARAFSVGLVSRMQDSPRCKAIVLVLVGLLVWTAVSSGTLICTRAPTNNILSLDERDNAPGCGKH